MATNSNDRKLARLQAENKRLRAENKALRDKVKPAKQPVKRSMLRPLAIILCIGFATALLVVGNLLFWTGNTIVKTDRFTEATAPIIKNSEVQSALAANATEKLFAQVDIDQITQDALPPRAAFLAPTLSEQIKQHTDDAIMKILQRPQFQERWNNSQERAHERFIGAVERHGSDGAIDISEVYADISQQLKDTRLSFLADKPLPAKVGQIEVVSGAWLTVLQRTIQNIDAWRTITLLLLLAVSALSVWLSRNRRKTVMTLAGFFAFSMFVTIVSLRIGREIVASNVDPQNAEAVRQAYMIFVNSLVVQTWTIFAASLLIAFVAWITGQSRSSQIARLKIDQFFSGKLHTAIFGDKENRFTLWLARHKRTLEWLIVAIAASLILFMRLTPTVLITQILVVVVVILIIEVLAAQQQKD